MKVINLKYPAFKSAFSLVELTVAMAVFLAGFGSLVFFAADSNRYSENSNKKVNAALFIQETTNALILSKQDLWLSILESTDDGPKSLVFNGTDYEIVDGPTIKDEVTLQIVITTANRNPDGSIAIAGGSPDLQTRQVDISASWTDASEKLNTINSVMYINDWSSPLWEETTVADFSDGVNDATYITNDVDGEVKLDTIYYPDWCSPEDTLTNHDIPGSATAKTIFSNIVGEAYFGTAGSSTGISFTHAGITGYDPPVLSIIGEYDGYIVNDLVVEGGYAYLATTNTAKEAVILDMATYTEVGYFNPTNVYGTDGDAVAVSGNYGYLGHGRYLRVFDISGKTGARSQVATETVGISGSYITKIKIVGNYAFISLYNDWDEIVIYDISNPLDPVRLGNIDVNTQQTYDFDVRADGNRVYLGTNSSSAKEFFIIDSTTKTGLQPIIASYESNGLTVRGVSFYEDDNVAIITGSGGEEYQVINMQDELNPSRCGGINFNVTVYDVETVKDAFGNAFSYVLTSASGSEFKIMRGGPGYGGGIGGNYANEGTYTSSILDAGSSAARYYSIELNFTEFNLTNIGIQVRSGNNADLSDGVWIGPDGTGLTFFDVGTSYLPESLSNKRYFQYRIILQSDTLETPVFDKLRIKYQK